ncbi:AAA family ATPase [Planctomycetota bacterium]|nr:AAA family ATPase [Planctomycetota bacterium]
MFLKSVRLENVRCLEDVEISFAGHTKKKNRKWTLIVGDNGLGKSTLLRSISLLMCGSEGLLDLVHRPGSWVRNGADECRISGVITTATGLEREVGLTLTRDLSKRKLLDDNAESLSRLDDALEHTTRSYLTVGYGSSRHARGSTGHRTNVYHHPRVRSVATLHAEHAKMIALESWAVDLFHNQKDRGLNMVRDALEGLQGGVAFDHFDEKRRRLMFMTPDGVVSLDHLSSGFRSMVGFCGDLLYRITETFGDYNNPLQARGLLLIDELGLHLHPRWQRVLMRFLDEKLPNIQIVATTNAPVTAHQAGEGELHYLVRDGAHAPPTLRKFEGSPNKLLLHQLILSPVFGVETGRSFGVECERKEHTKLKRKRTKSAQDKRRLKKLQASLAEVADWDQVPTKDQDKLAELLSRIDSKLQKPGA